MFAAVNVGGVLFVPSVAIAEGDVLADPFMLVEQRVGCQDEGPDGVSLIPGASNFLEAGTPLFRIVDVSEDAGLAFRSDVSQTWYRLSPRGLGP